jgi:hypothetical protein
MMRPTRRAARLLTLTAAAVAVAALGGTPVASAAQFNCPAGYFCMYSGWGGGGARCAYRQNTRNTADNCSFIRAGRNVRSVWNGNGHTATYYRQTNFNGRVGSTKPGHGGNLMGTYQIRSIRF